MEYYVNIGETITFSIFAPLKDVFANTDSLEFENPSIELKGYVKDEKIEIQFGISGGLGAFDDNF
ncbi:hypothetical protein [Halalkalibacillus sediminis]|uniref:hypothetical protein n=1 Tax=Halalkalibacillus sediminis TaxID=2018042 RepID=UPI000C6EA41D|nr:hypothetical protein [Halalkalibacillus sediminis]